MVPVIEEGVITTSKLEEKMPVHVIPDERENMRPNKSSENSSGLKYLKKDVDTDVDTSA